MADLIDTTEMYLKTILELEEDGVTPLRARIVDRLGHSGPTASQTVARWEPVMSDAVEARLVDLLSDPSVDPYGNPLPGVDGGERLHSAELAVRSLESGALTLGRIGEPIQADAELLASFDELGLRPGARVGLSAHGDVVRVAALDGSGEVSGYLTLPMALAAHLFVRGE